MDAPWLPKSESGTRSPGPHFRHRGNVCSTHIAPSNSSHMSSTSAACPRQQRSPGARKLSARCPPARSVWLVAVHRMTLYHTAAAAWQDDATHSSVVHALML